MARLFTAGFETGSTEWNGATTLVGVASVTVLSTVKRTGDYSVRFSGVNDFNSATIRQVFDDNETELYGRMALQINSNAGQNNYTILSLRDSSNNPQMLLRYAAGTSTLSWHNGAGTLVALGNVLVPTDTWVVVEWHVVISNSGSAIAKVNGTTDAVFSGDTDYTNVGDVRSVYFGMSYVSGTTPQAIIYLDDIAINNAEGSYENSWPGLGGTFWLRPNADGDQNDWTPSAGTANWDMVDDVPPDNATTFNQALDSGAIDLYEVADCPQYIAAVRLVQVAYRAALVTSGYNELTDLVKTGGTVYQGKEYTIVPITPSFTYYLGTPYYLNPQTSAAWGTVEVNAMQVGAEITT